MVGADAGRARIGGRMMGYWITAMLFGAPESGDSETDANGASFVEAEVRRVWEHAPDSWGVFVLAAAAAVVAWWVVGRYRSERASVTPAVRRTLVGLRLTAWLCVAVVLLGPARVEIERRTLLPPIVVLRDASRSMGTIDRRMDAESMRAAAELSGVDEAAYRAAPASRIELGAKLLSGDGASRWKALRSLGRVRLRDFAERTRPAAGSAWTAEGGSTDLSGAVRDALTAPAPAAIVLLTDGRHTGLDDPLEAAREAGRRNAPLLIVGLGDADRPRNLRVASVETTPQAWKDEPFELEVSVFGRGVRDGELAELELTEQRLDDSNELSAPAVVTRRTLTWSGGEGRISTTIAHRQSAPGRYVYTASLKPLTGEAATDDNRRNSAPMQVLDREQVRVLLVSSGPGWDYQFLERLLSRDRTAVVSCWLQSLDERRAQAGSRPIGRFPTTSDELFAYDVVLLLDPDPQDLGGDWLELLKRFTGEHGGGVLFMAGPRHSGRLLSSPAAAALRDLLPVRLPDAERIELSTLPSGHVRAWPLKPVVGSGDHPLLRLGADAGSEADRWESLPGAYWSFPALEAKPTATTLIEHSDPTLRSSTGARPLLTAGRFGAGRTLYLGFHGAWRWRSAGRNAEYYDRFWIQAIRFLVEGRALEGRRRGVLRTDREQYELGDRVVVTAQLYDTQFAPSALPEVRVRVSASDGTATESVLRAVAGRPGQYLGGFTPRKLGVYRAVVELPSDGPEPGRKSETAEAAFAVELPERETAETWLNEPLLREMASESGGRYFTLAEARELPASVPDRRETIEIRRPPKPLWDRPWLLAAAVGALAAEWMLRKRCRLL